MPVKLLDEQYTLLKLHLSQHPLTLIHPLSHFQTALITRLRADKSVPTLYYRMSESDTDLPSFLLHLTDTLSEQSPHFGTHTNAVLFDTPDIKDQVSLPLAQDIALHSTTPPTLILHDFDCAQPHADLADFLENFSDHLPQHTSLLVTGRSIPPFPWLPLIIQGKAIITRDGEAVIPTLSNENPRLRITAFGVPSLTLDDVPITAWRGWQPRSLLFFLLQRPTTPFSPIHQAIWPFHPLQSARDTLHSARTKLNTTLHQLHREIITLENNHFAVNAEIPLRYDLFDLAAALIYARANPTKPDTWQAVIDLYPNHFLPGHKEKWIREARLDYYNAYLEALINLAKLGSLNITNYLTLFVPPHRTDLYAKLHTLENLFQLSPSTAHLSRQLAAQLSPTPIQANDSNKFFPINAVPSRSPSESQQTTRYANPKRLGRPSRMSPTNEFIARTALAIRPAQPTTKWTDTFALLITELQNRAKLTPLEQNALNKLLQLSESRAKHRAASVLQKMVSR